MSTPSQVLDTDKSVLLLTHIADTGPLITVGN